MEREYFLALEKAERGTTLSLDTVLEQIAFDGKGLIPVVTQDAHSKQVVMFAYMNREALQETITTGRMTYWSRSRKKLWVKGETSGHTQRLVAMSVDCDGDAVLCQVERQGPACHTGRDTCFYLHIDAESKQVVIT